MKKLLSLPPGLTGCFHEMEKLPANEWLCASDPEGQPLGSAGGSILLLDECKRIDDSELPFGEWLALEKRIIIHAGGQSRRLPAYAAWGKILTPLPVFRWARGQRLNQNLLSLQIPLYEEIMNKAPDSLHTMVTSGDVYIRCTKPIQDIPKADVVCFGLWTDPAPATRHGVFFSERDNPGTLDFMLQKPAMDRLTELAGSHLFLMDIGIWLLSDRAVECIAKRSRNGNELMMYDLYGSFGRALGMRPEIRDGDINALSVAILPLPGGEFYHFGTGQELISSALAIQNLVRDQRLIMQRTFKPHPAMFVQNAQTDIILSSDNSELWIENSHIGPHWQLTDRHILTGIPHNDWTLKLSPGTCIDIVPVGAGHFAARPYGFYDSFRGKADDPDTSFLGKPFRQWISDRELRALDTADIQYAKLFPLCRTTEELETVLAWMISDPENSRGKIIWESALKLSANDLLARANLLRLAGQRKDFMTANLSALASNHEKSIFYQLDLDDAATSFADANLPLPHPLAADAPLMKRIHDSMFRARTLSLGGYGGAAEEQKAFALLSEGLIGEMKNKKVTPRSAVYHDQIVWGRSPVRIDLAGGWTDTPPYCLYAGGNVLNVAIELNGQPPLQVYVKPSADYALTLRSIDLGAVERIDTWQELGNYNRVGSPFSIPKAAMSLAGFMPGFSAIKHSSLEEQFRDFGCGMEITLLSAIPKGSGLGTSSILAATVLGALSDFCGLGWDKTEICNRTLVLEQLLTTGGGWQDQFGGVLHGLKLLQTDEGFNQNPLVRWLPDYIFTDALLQPCHLLYYTGITRTAKDILSGIVKAMFLNSSGHLALLAAMKTHATDMYEAIQYGNFNDYGTLLAKTWEQKKAIDTGANPPALEPLLSAVSDYTLGYQLPGAGGGGYLYMVAKDPEAAVRIKQALAASNHHPNARMVDMTLSRKGMQISRS
jgi:galactokinase/mevalonate kinase-like predicted kinase